MKTTEFKVWKLAKHLTDQIHGSGVDGDWRLMKDKNYAVIKNSFHSMDEYGNYDGWQDFSIKLPLNGNVEEFKLVFNGNRYMSTKHNLGEYLEDLFSMTISIWLETYEEKYTVIAYNDAGKQWSMFCLNLETHLARMIRNQSPVPAYRISRIEIKYPGGV